MSNFAGVSDLDLWWRDRQRWSNHHRFEHAEDACVHCGEKEPFSHQQPEPCKEGQPRAGAYWLGMLGFALAGPAALESAAQSIQIEYHDSDGVCWTPDYYSGLSYALDCLVRAK